ncbi:hypothetical protein GN956_G9491 [Arapaima gigas]
MIRTKQNSIMRAGTAGIVICFCLLGFLMFQAFMKEKSVQATKAKVRDASEEVERKEAEIVQAKLRIQELNAMIIPSNSKRDELLKKQADLKNSEKETMKNLETCQTQKSVIEKKKNDVVEIVKKLKADQDKEKMAAEDQIKKLKQQILERDKKLCQFVDKKQEEGKKACETLEATK